MNVNGGQGLWHGRRMRQCASPANPKGVCSSTRERAPRFECPNGASASSPRLARQCLPWVTGQHGKKRQRRCGPKPNVAATPLLRWVSGRNGEQPQRGCGRLALRLEMLVGRFLRVAHSSPVRSGPRNPWALGHSLVGAEGKYGERFVW